MKCYAIQHLKVQCNTFNAMQHLGMQCNTFYAMQHLEMQCNTFQCKEASYAYGARSSGGMVHRSIKPGYPLGCLPPLFPSLEYTLHGTVQIQIQIQIQIQNQAWVPTGLPTTPFSQLRIYTSWYCTNTNTKYKLQIQNQAWIPTRLPTTPFSQC